MNMIHILLFCTLALAQGACRDASPVEAIYTPGDCPPGAAALAAGSAGRSPGWESKKSSKPEAHSAGLGDASRDAPAPRPEKLSLSESEQRPSQKQRSDSERDAKNGNPTDLEGQRTERESGTRSKKADDARAQGRDTSKRSSKVTSGAAKVDPEADPGPRRRSDAISKIDINRASAAELETLPGIGPALARRILDYRRRRPFRSIDHLERVRGIGPATMRKIRDRLTVGASW